MDRDMDRRPRDIPPEDRYGGGQSYRPGAAGDRSPPRRDRDHDTYRARSPPPRRPYDPRPPPRGRSRSPPPFRRRSLSPRDRFRDPRGADTYRARPRSPVRRENLPRDDLFRREPERDVRKDFREDRDYRDDRGYRDGRPYGGRSPPRYRDRPPPIKRGRDPSPLDRGRRTPPAARGDRLTSPARGRYDSFPPSRAQSPPRRAFSPPRGMARDPPRPRSPPPRNDNVDRRMADDWRRPRSPSPRVARRDHDLDDRGRESTATSRRSSPPVHPSRLGPVQSSADDRIARAPPRESYDGGNSYGASRASEPRFRDPSPPRDGRGDQQMAGGFTEPGDRAVHTLESHRPDENLSSRPPPSGPSGYRPPAASTSAPTGPAASMPAANTPRGPPVPPSGPRSEVSATRGGFAPARGRGGYGSEFVPRGRGGYSATFRGGAAPYGRGQPYDREANFAPPTGPPSGPRNLTGPPFRPTNNRTTSTVPQSQRFDVAVQTAPDTPTGPRAASASSANPFRRPPLENGHVPSGPASDRDRDRARARDTRRPNDGIHPSLRDLPEIIPNGQKAPPVADRTRLNKLEEEAERLRQTIYEKEAKKRKSLREWDRLVREGETAAVRSEVAEASVRAFEGEGEAAGSAF